MDTDTLEQSKTSLEKRLTESNDDFHFLTKEESAKRTLESKLLQEVKKLKNSQSK